MPRNSGKNSGQLVKQPHGGALLTGGVSGHRGAGGRPPNRIRMAILQEGWSVFPEIVKIARGESSTGQTVHPSQQISAWKAMMDLSLPKVVEECKVTTEAAHVFKAAAIVFSRYFPIEDVPRLLDEMGAELDTEWPKTGG
ncbi:MAG: hypothetical protein ABL949_13600 [Fimbriimonadaceae bacterium]